MTDNMGKLGLNENAKSLPASAMQGLQWAIVQRQL